MIKVGISGCNGAMGRVLTGILNQTEDMDIVLGIDRNPNLHENIYPVYENASKVDISCDVVIDFSHPSVLEDRLNFCIKNKTAIVLATTGISKEQEKTINEASSYIPIFKSSNTSVGVNLIIDLVRKAASVLSDEFDIEIIEKHHNKKIDAPSGTAYMIANAINEELDDSLTYNYGRGGFSAKREKNEIGIHAVRGGTIPGEHTIIFAGMDEIIEIKHSALSKRVFADGAIKAAQYISSKEPGLYTMKDLINEN